MGLGRWGLPHQWQRGAKLPNLRTLCAELPRYGLWQKVFRSTWLEKGYDPHTHHYVITRFAPSKDQIWGKKVWKGKEEKEAPIGTWTRREWAVVPQEPASAYPARSPRAASSEESSSSS